MPEHGVRVPDPQHHEAQRDCVPGGGHIDPRGGGRSPGRLDGHRQRRLRRRHRPPRVAAAGRGTHRELDEHRFPRLPTLGEVLRVQAQSDARENAGCLPQAPQRHRPPGGEIASSHCPSARVARQGPLGTGFCHLLAAKVRRGSAPGASRRTRREPELGRLSRDEARCGGTLAKFPRPPTQAGSRRQRAADGLPRQNRKDARQHPRHLDLGKAA
mmetsp:Transcript_53423/g.155427  ORF Transcript_53423/g.155427 Transcript_53423/m.155427 type:complete len:214 (+) Transcript_53423:2981-3622(+)